MSRNAFLFGILCLVAVHAAHLKSNGHPRAQAQAKSYIYPTNIYIYIYPRSDEVFEYKMLNESHCPTGYWEVREVEECRKAFVQLTGSTPVWYFRRNNTIKEPDYCSINIGSPPRGNFNSNFMGRATLTTHLRICNTR